MNAGRLKISYWCLPLLIAVGCWGVSHLNTAEMLEKRLLDVRFKLRGPRAVESTPFQIVAVDDQSFRQLQEKWPFGGSLFARLIRNLNSRRFT